MSFYSKEICLVCFSLKNSNLSKKNIFNIHIYVTTADNFEYIQNKIVTRFILVSQTNYLTLLQQVLK